MGQRFSSGQVPMPDNRGFSGGQSGAKVNRLIDGIGRLGDNNATSLDGSPTGYEDDGYNPDAGYIPV